MKYFNSVIAAAVLLGLLETAPVWATEEKQCNHQLVEHQFTVYEEVAAFMEIKGRGGLGYPGNNVEFTGLGNDLLINNELHDADPTASDSRVVGVSRNVCTRVSADKMSFFAMNARTQVKRISRCDLVLELEGGNILASGIFYENAFEQFETQQFSVIGGTGKYLGGVGDISLTQVVYPGTVVKLDINIKTIAE